MITDVCLIEFQTKRDKERARGIFPMSSKEHRRQGAAGICLSAWHNYLDNDCWVESTHTHTPHKARKLKIPNEVCCEVKRDMRWKRVQTDHLIHSVNTEDFKELHIFFGATNSKAILWLAQTWPQPKRKGKRKRKDRGGGRAPQSQAEKWS